MSEGSETTPEAVGLDNGPKESTTETEASEEEDEHEDYNNKNVCVGK